MAGDLDAAWGMLDWATRRLHEARGPAARPGASRGGSTVWQSPAAEARGQVNLATAALRKARRRLGI